MADTRAPPRAFFAMAVAFTAAALLAALAYSVTTLPIRPLDGVEGEVVYEAARLRAALPLYTDPVAGAFDQGALPSRFFVLYPPLWSFFLSLFPQSVSVLWGRAVACLSWFGALALLAWRAPPERRRAASLAAAFAGGIFTLTLFGSAARPDACALALAALALGRSARKGAPDAGSGALFALAAWTKPNVIGIAAGAFGAGLRVNPRSTGRALAAALALSAVVAAVLHRASSGAWLEHLVRSTGQPLSGSVWREQALWRLQFVGAPLALALVAGWQARADPRTAIPLGALGASTLWAFVSLAKIGAASNYWMEPALAAVAVLARADVPPRVSIRGAWAFAGAVLFQAAWTGVGSARSSIEAIGNARAHRDLVDGARAECGARPQDIVIADEPGLEVMLDGRLLATPFQLTHLVREGRMSAGPWIDDLRRPEVRCLLLEDDILERPPGREDVARDRFPPALVRALRERFVRVDERAGWRLYRARDEGLPR